MDELLEIAQFIKDFERSDSIGEMERQRDRAIGYAQRIGELLDQAEHDYTIFYGEKLDELSSSEDETETTRKAKLNMWTADKLLIVKKLRTLKHNLRTITMACMQSIKTKRETP